jgi:16S rRNA (cytidine1402-2'-O)-methyltransferase
MSAEHKGKDRDKDADGREGQEKKDERDVAALYVVATPIGNLEDISQRALRTLSEVELIAAEDTRMTARLLDRHGVRTRMLSLHEHNEAKRSDEVIALLDEGRSVALVSDAGTPAISDPGAVLAGRVRAAGHRIVPIPGPSALTAALSVAGMEGTAFHFAGFLPEKSTGRRKAIAALSGLDCTLAFYEAPHRVQACVRDLAAELQERDIVIARELTKMFESVHRCALSHAAAWLEADSDRQRGEFVLLVSGAPAKAETETTSVDADKLLKTLMAELPLAQSVKLACAITGLKRGVLYPRALELSGQKPQAGR